MMVRFLIAVISCPALFAASRCIFDRHFDLVNGKLSDHEGYDAAWQRDPKPLRQRLAAGNAPKSEDFVAQCCAGFVFFLVIAQCTPTVKSLLYTTYHSFATLHLYMSMSTIS